MYSILGPCPGGSAATSFCSGTEMSIMRRAIMSSLEWSCAPGSALAQHRIAQHADAVDGKLDRVAALEKTPDLQPAAVADGARAEHFSRVNGLVLRGVGEKLLEGKEHVLRFALGARLAVDADLDLERLGIADLVRSHDPGAEHVRAVEALALGRTEPALHLDRLAIARGKIVEDGVAEDVRAGLALRNVRARGAGDDRDLELVVHHLAVARPMDGRSRSDDCQPVGDVVDRELAIHRRQVFQRLLHH